jgi:hypothetical protein
VEKRLSAKVWRELVLELSDSSGMALLQLPASLVVEENA